MECLCGKQMFKLGEVEPPDKIINLYSVKMTLYACPPHGCGRIYLQGSGAEVSGTWYLAETNDRKELV
jgi:hypothetical protein